MRFNYFDRPLFTCLIDSRMDLVRCGDSDRVRLDYKLLVPIGNFFVLNASDCLNLQGRPVRVDASQMQFVHKVELLTLMTN